MSACPTTVGVYVTLHVPDARVQLVTLNVPVELLANETVPVGVPLPEVTVTVQVEAVLSRTLAGEHATDVVLAFWPTASRNVPLLRV
jgi:hypothetical protein